MSSINIAFQTCNNGAICLICADCSGASESKPGLPDWVCYDWKSAITDARAARTLRNTSRPVWEHWHDSGYMTEENHIFWLVQLDFCQIRDQVRVKGKMKSNKWKACGGSKTKTLNTQQRQHRSLSNRLGQPGPWTQTNIYGDLKMSLHRFKDVVKGCTKSLKLYIWL